jgi:NAD(P)-dependent dehydrogenase (short-subunit alcohol dehydrogenase family)
MGRTMGAMGTPRTALITGAGGGIGRAFAVALVRAGDRVKLLDLDERALTETMAALPRGPGSAANAAADVGDGAALEAAIDRLLGTAGLDLVITCAAILGPGTWARQEPEAFERVLRVDLLGTVNTVRAALPALGRARGQVVILASTAAVHGWPGLAAYSAAKFAVAGWAEGIRAELAAEGIGVTVVFPLLIDTPLLRGSDIPPILRRGRRLPPEAVARKVLRAAARRRRRVYVPGTVRLLAALHGLAPSLLDWYGARFGIERC